MLTDAMAAVAAFHKDVLKKEQTNLLSDEPMRYLGAVGKQLLLMSKHLAYASEVNEQDSRALRAHLIVEEVGELLVAMSTGDAAETLDGLADAVYVLIGTALQFGLPLSEAFAEVHRSNMTKTTQESRTGHPAKGPGFSPPNLKGLL
jgi:NTP pyrophosphatase (non-canonical NTP hydrolase)